MVARGAGTAGPVLLACRQWDPLGLARRLPSLGVGAWRSAPLLPWRVQCPVPVCAALAAGSGGADQYLVLCLSRFPLPAPRVPRCVWQAVPSGCPLPSLAGTPFHAGCAFRELGPVALLVVPACPLRVCALALLRRPLPPPLGGVACAPRAVPALGAGRAVPRGPCPSACPAPVPCSVWRAWGGGGPVPVPPYLAWGCVPPGGRVCGVHVPGGGWGGGGVPCALPPVCAARGASRVGGCSASFRPSAFPGQATKRVSLASFWSWGAWPPYHSRFSSPAFSGRDLCGVLARWRSLACSPRFLWELAAGAGGRAVLRLLSRAGGGGVAAGAAACGPVGGLGGGVAPRPACSPSGGRPAVSYPGAPLVVGALPPGVRVRSGPGAAPGGGWGMRGGTWTAPPGAPSDLIPPSALPEWAMVMGGVMGGAAPILFWCAAVCCPQAWSARRSGALVWARPSAATPAGVGGWGRRGARCAGPDASPPSPRCGPFWGRGGVPSAPGGRRVAPVSLKLGGGAGGEAGGRSAAPRPPASSGVGLPSVVSSAPPRGILVPWGLPGGRGRRARPGRPPMRQRGVGGREGGGTPAALVRALAFSRPASEEAAPFAPSWAPPVRRRSASGRAGACGRFTGGACGGRSTPSPRVQRPLRGGCGAAVSSVCPRPLLGLRGRGGGVGGALWPPGAAP